jgi:hypothetical protein
VLLRERLEARAEREDSTLSRELRAALRRYLADEGELKLEPAAGRITTNNLAERGSRQ